MEELDIENILSGEGAVRITQTDAIPKDVAGDLIPIGVQTPSLENTEPFQLKTQTRSEPALRVAGPGGTERHYYSLHPAQIYGPAYVEEHALAFGNWIRNTLISFVRSVAGMQGLAANDLLQTGFEDLTSIMRETLQQSNDMFLPGSVYDTSSVVNNFGAAVKKEATIQGQFPPRLDEVQSGTQPQPPVGAKEINPAGLPETTRKGEKFTDIDYESEYGQEVIADLVRLAKLLQGFGKSDDILRVFRYLQNRTERYDYGVVKWLTLPMNLSAIYFKDTLKAAVENALNDVLRIRNMLDNGTLFAELLNSDQSNTFAQLVSRHLDKFKWNRTRGDKRLKESEQIQQDIEELAYRLRNVAVTRTPVGTPTTATTVIATRQFNPI